MYASFLKNPLEKFNEKILGFHSYLKQGITSGF